MRYAAPTVAIGYTGFVRCCHSEPVFDWAAAEGGLGTFRFEGVAVNVSIALAGAVAGYV